MYTEFSKVSSMLKFGNQKIFLSDLEIKLKEIELNFQKEMETKEKEGSDSTNEDEDNDSTKNNYYYYYDELIEKELNQANNKETTTSEDSIKEEEREDKTKIGANSPIGVSPESFSSINSFNMADGDSDGEDDINNSEFPDDPQSVKVNFGNDYDNDGDIDDVDSDSDLINDDDELFVQNITTRTKKKKKVDLQEILIENYGSPTPSKRKDSQDTQTDSEFKSPESSIPFAILFTIYNYKYEYF